MVGFFKLDIWEKASPGRVQLSTQLKPRQRASFSLRRARLLDPVSALSSSVGSRDNLFFIH